MSLRVYIGYDERQETAWKVASKTALSFGCTVIPLYEQRLRELGLLTRPLHRQKVDGSVRMFDLNSSAYQSTDFAIARFFVPMLAHDGWALFVDSDVVLMDDPRQLLWNADPNKAVYVVKHPILDSSGQKMDGQEQAPYYRKNWSSVTLFNAGHKSNRRLNLTTLNMWPGRDLHAFAWLHDSEIGSLDPEWNWLVGIQEKPEFPKIAHFTEGVPDMPGYENSQHAEIWWDALRS